MVEIEHDAGPHEARKDHLGDALRIGRRVHLAGCFAFVEVALYHAPEPDEALVYLGGEPGALPGELHGEGHEDATAGEGVRVGQVAVAVVFQELLQSVDRVHVVIQPGQVFIAPYLPGAREGRGEELFLGLEVVVEAALGGARRGDDVRGGGVDVALYREELEGLVDDAVFQGHARSRGPATVQTDRPVCLDSSRRGGEVSSRICFSVLFLEGMFA
jgi:hypothetical protein